jgi:putative oxidoreductase
MRTLLHPASRLPGSLDLALLVTRVALGFILLAHGWQKLDTYTLAGTAASFGDMGIPLPTLAAYFVTAVELIGGAALVLGVLTPLAGLLNMVSLLGALVLVHVQSGVFVENGGYELVLALAVGLLIVALQGAGRYSIDGLLGRRVASQ